MNSRGRYSAALVFVMLATLTNTVRGQKPPGTGDDPRLDPHARVAHQLPSSEMATSSIISPPIRS
jgi:hypothetical protein